MAVNSSKATLGHLYRRINADLGTPISAVQMAAGDEAPNYETYEFIEAVNGILRDLAGETEMLHRIYILRPDVGMMRYIKYTREEGEGGILRIDLDGQTATLPGGAADPECLGIQYEKICDGTGINVFPAGVKATDIAPDMFPKIYLPAEADIDPSIYDPTLPMARLKGAGGLANRPALSSLFDIAFVGWSTGDITDTANYPTPDREDDYFIDIFMVAALQYITYTLGTNGAIPRSADAYLNDTWETILGWTAGAGVAGIGGAPTFVVDGVTYTVAIGDAGYNIVGNDGFTFTITDGVSTWSYGIRPDDTPWETVSTNYVGFIGPPVSNYGTNRWGNLFAAGQDHAWYLKLDDQRIKLPDDVEKIEWVWKIPKASWTELIDEDSTVDNELSSIGDSDWFLYNPMDRLNHYFPLTESMWSSIKWMQTMGYISKNYAGFYIQKGQQIRVEPKTTDPIAISVQCRSDLADDSTTIDDFDGVYLEVPALAIDCIHYRMIADYYISGRSGGTDRADRWDARYQKAKNDLKKLYVLKQGQQADSPSIRLRMQSQRHSNAFGWNILQAPLRRWDQK